MSKKEISEAEYVKMLQDEYCSIQNRIREITESLPISIQELNGCQNYLMMQLVQEMKKFNELCVILDNYRGMKRFKDRKVQFFTPVENEPKKRPLHETNHNKDEMYK